eukprot:4527130-Amphidinium_carterae.1
MAAVKTKCGTGIWASSAKARAKKIKAKDHGKGKDSTPQILRKKTRKRNKILLWKKRKTVLKHRGAGSGGHSLQEYVA